MDPLTALTTVVSVINLLGKMEPELVAGFKNIKAFGTTLFEEFTGQKISDADLATLESRIDDLHLEFQTPLPPAQPGDPDYQA